MIATEKQVKIEEKLPYMKFSELIRLGMEKKAGILSIDFKRNIADFIKGCREDKGIPMFRTRFAGQPIVTPEGERAVLGVCWGGEDKMPSFWFKNVPKEDIELIDRYTGDWRHLWLKYGEKEKLKELEKLPIVL